MLSAGSCKTVSGPGPAEIRGGEGKNPPVRSSVDVLVLALWWDMFARWCKQRSGTKLTIWQQRDAACPPRWRFLL